PTAAGSRRAAASRAGPRRARAARSRPRSGRRPCSGGSWARPPRSDLVVVPRVARYVTARGPAMLLVLLRHGIAQDRVEGGVDADRRLTPRGLRRTREAVQGLRALGVAPRVVLSSPYRRARETAELAIEALGPRGVEVVPT